MAASALPILTPIKRPVSGAANNATPIAVASSAIAGNSANTGSLPSNLPSLPFIGSWSQFPGRAGTYIANDINAVGSGIGFQVTYTPSTGQWAYSNPYAGVFTTGSSLKAAVTNFENKYDNVPVATLAYILGGSAATVTPSTSSTPTTSTPAVTANSGTVAQQAPTTETAAPVASSTTSTSTTSTDPTAAVISALAGLLGNDGASSSGDTSGDTTTSAAQPTVLPVTGGTTSSNSSVGVIVVIVLVLAAGGAWWYFKHKHHAGVTA